MERIRWVERLKHEQILKRVEEEWGLLHLIPKGKENCLVHSLRGNGLLTSVLEGTVGRGKRRKRRRINVVNTWKS